MKTLKAIIVILLMTMLASPAGAWLWMPDAGSSSGGAGTPGGSVGDIQCNIAGAFGACATPALPNGTTATTQAADTNSTAPATTAFVMAQRGRDQAEYSNGTCTASKTISAANGNWQKVTLTNAQTCALTFTQPTAGTMLIHLKIIQSAVSTFNGIISAAGVLWPGGVGVPAITATSGAVDFIDCYLDGSVTYCRASQDYK